MKALWVALAALCLGACATPNPTQTTDNQALDGSWRIAQVGAETVPMVGSVTKMLRFETAASKFSGNAGCNRLFGVYEHEGARLNFNGIATTQMACDPVSMQLEQKVIKLIENVQSWQIIGDRKSVV